MDIISNYTNRINNTGINHSFKGQRVLSLWARRQFGQKVSPIPLAVTKLSIEEDKKLMQALLPVWVDQTTYGGKIIPAFLSQKIDDKRKLNLFIGFFRDEFYMLENPIEKDPLKRIKALLMLNNYRKFFFINFIQSASELSSKRQFDGGGSILLYALVKLAKKLKKNSVELTSTVDTWYDRLGFCVPGCGKFYFPVLGDTVLKKRDFPETIKFVEKHYDLMF